MLTGNIILMFFRVKFYNLFHQFGIMFKYYRNLKFGCLDIAFSLIYLFFDPYKVSKGFLKNMGLKNIHIYGETPLLSFAKIISQCNLTDKDYFMDFGSGRSLNCMWLAINYSCRVVGVEWIELFVRIGNVFKRHFHIANLELLNTNRLDIDLNKVTYLYLYDIILSSELVEKLKTLDKGAKIITISYPITYYEIGSYVIQKIIKVSFPWGQTYAYVQEKQ